MIMVNKTKYGVISDVHADPRMVPIAIDILRSLGAEKLLVNGDIGSLQGSIQGSQDYVASILDSIGKSGLESFVQPGSHDSIYAHFPVMEYFSGKYPNIIDTTKVRKVEQDGHQLVFLPGHDVASGREYRLGGDEIFGKDLETGLYMSDLQNPGKWLPIKNLQQYVAAVKGLEGRIPVPMHYTNANDLRKMVADPDKTIVVCHIPRKFDDIDTCVDGAYFAITPEKTVVPGIFIENEIKRQFPNADLPYSSDDGEVASIEGIARDRGYILNKENRGNVLLKSLYEELGITKAVSGHFHESGHRAHDSYGRRVGEGELVSDLFWNSGHLDAGQTGVLTVSDGKVSYQNIRIHLL